jgi:hypothetical protein
MLGRRRVPSVDERRLIEMESRLGTRLPSDFVATLHTWEPIREGNLALVTAGRVWDVRTTFALDANADADQLDRVYDLIGDVLPPGTLPFAQDWGGNFYCVLLSGPSAGAVVYWDHERDEDDTHLEPVANSIEAFYSALIPDPRGGDA